MARAFKLHTVNSDGSNVESEGLIEYLVIDDQTNKPYRDDDGKPCVTITLRPISQTKYRAVVQHNTERIPARKGQPPSQETDWDAVQDELVAYTIVSWKGILGADNKPLDCCLDAKVNIPGDLKNDVVKRAMHGEGVDATPESFRATA